MAAPRSPDVFTSAAPDVVLTSPAPDVSRLPALDPSDLAPAARTLGYGVTLNGMLRIGVACCYLGHGAFGLVAKPAWTPLFGFAGIPPDDAVRWMPWVGASDIALGVLALLWPVRVVFLHLVVWGLWTASLRPLTGLPFAEMIERAGNYGVPLAALALSAGMSWWRPVVTWHPSPRAIARAEFVLRATTALLLVGHGLLALAGSATQRRLHAGVGLAATGLDTVTLAGAVDLALGAAALVAGRPWMFVGIAAWKIASEALFPLSGDSWLEFIERAGSFVAPLALAAIVGRPRALRPDAPAARGTVGSAAAAR